MSRLLIFPSLSKFSNLQVLTSMSKKCNKGKQKSKEIPPAVKEEPTAVTLSKSNNILISILAKPGARQSAITGISPEGVGVQISAPPSEGEANTELVKYMASVLGLKKNDVVLDRGFKSRSKVLKITGSITLEEVNRKIQEEMSDT